MSKQPRARFSRAAFTFVELSVYMLLVGVLTVATYSFMRSSMMLAAKGAGLNQSHASVRKSLDRLAMQLQSANNVPTLIDTNGSTTNGPAAGVRYDCFVGDHYILNPALTAGSVSATATSIRVIVSTHALAGPPIPVVNDVLLLNTPRGTVRSRITGVNAGIAGASTRPIDLTLATPVGVAFSWPADRPQVARVVRPQAFIVMPAGARNELRFYPSFDPLPPLNDPARHVVLTSEIGTQGGESTPFSIVSVNGDRLVQANVRVRAREHDGWLANRQANTFNTLFRLNATLPSRLRPELSN